ncbi:peptidoglycan recognition protein family protein [Streptomyces meridianus]|uniref:N-acetylmuramoyl-L-alanine amidase n=1 Tax=Streptomyces meridianus TaxID=2938945 RepID=A0ABT0X9K9_9ACTN|nr:N-acetylmuramoyl-L-alanine amidase [Streptomyces meridianus]MCM2579220.1 N-acetylmuramoyl-L-alanine amidase [Streptomyces meridianus]
MRALLASSIGVACAAALAFPLAMPAGATATPVAFTEPAGSTRASATDSRDTDRVEKRASLPGATQSLPLEPLDADQARALVDLPGAAGAKGLTEREVKPFSLVGIVWEDADTELHGRVQVRTRSTETKKWSEWQAIEPHTDDVPDPGSPEPGAAPVRGSTAPLWVGASDGVEVQVLPDGTSERSGGEAPALPDGMHLELIDPGADPAAEDTTGAPLSEEAAESSAANAPLAAPGAKEIPAETPSTSDTAEASGTGTDRGATAKHIGPRPGIVTRAGWGADEKLREPGFRYTSTVKAAFVHHSASGNGYSCSQAPALIRSIYRYHVKSNGWRDVGYNFFVDKCGKIYEGRAGGVVQPVMGAHTLGFNSNTMGIAVLGTFTSAAPPKAALDGVAKLTAWKLGLFGRNPGGTTTLTSAGGKYKAGTKVKMKVISGHRDGFATECPGAKLYAKLGTIRSTASRLQGR